MTAEVEVDRAEDVAARPVWRAVAAWVFVLIVTPVYLVAAGVALSLTDRINDVGGWRWGIAAFAPVVALAGWVVRPRGRWRNAVVGAVVGVLLGYGGYAHSSPTAHRLDHEFADLGTPAGWTMVDKHEEDATWCLFAQCSSVTYEFETPVPVRQAITAYVDHLRRHGWPLAYTSPDDVSTRQFRRHGREIVVHPVGPDRVEVGYEFLS